MANLTKPLTFEQRLLASGPGQQMLKDEQTSALGRRRKLAVERQQLRAKYEAESQPLRKDEEETVARRDAAKDAWEAARIKHGDALFAYAACSSHYDYLLGQIEAELTATAPAAIGEFIGELRTLHDEVGRTPMPDAPIEWTGAPSPGDLERLGKAVAQRDAKMARCLAAIPQAAALRFEVLDAATLTQRFDAIRRVVDEEVK